MQHNFKKTYRFALKTSFLITLILSLCFSVFLIYYHNFNWLFLYFPPSCFILCFVVIQYRVEHFIYKRIKTIYDDISLLDNLSLRPKAITTDVKTLTEEIDKYAKTKKLEIETLKIREEYRKEFMGNVSHELKTPLFTVQGYIETLLDGAIDDKKINKKYLTRANKGVERLIYIVKDLDMITQLESGNQKLYPENFNIVELIKSVFELFEMKASKKKISLVLEEEYEPILVYADKERIEQVLINLVVNSIKYGREKGTTEVSIDDLTDDRYIIRITDNGEGIDEEHLPRLFERFYRVDKSGSRKEGGSGLGLSIVKHIIEGHQEKIYVESEPNVGSEFSFTLEKANIHNHSEKESVNYN